ncbi:MAG: flavin reductase [Treponema sp.]|nr:flavin reductase [Treponema sp.]
MKKDFGKQTYMFPMPVLIIATYDENGIPNAMNAAWGGIHDTNQIGICLSHEHKTVKNILAKKAFTVSMADVKNVVPCDYVGVVSGNDTSNKIEIAGWTVTKSPNVDAPIINELPMCLECTLVSYDEKSDYMVADIVNVSAEENVLTDGKIDVAKVNPITYDPVSHKYLSLGEVAGTAFKDGLKLKK